MPKRLKRIYGHKQSSNNGSPAGCGTSSARALTVGRGSGILLSLDYAGRSRPAARASGGIAILAAKEVEATRIHFVRMSEDC